MNIFQFKKQPKKQVFSRGLYQAIKELNNNILGRKRKKLRQKAQKILNQKESLVKKIHAVKTQERAYRAEKRDYESLVRAVERKLSYTETAPLTERQKELDAFCLDVTTSREQDGMEM